MLSARSRSIACAALCLVLALPGPSGAQSRDDLAFDAWVGLARVRRDAGALAEAAAAWREAAMRKPLPLPLQVEQFWVISRLDAAGARRLANTVLTQDPGATEVRARALELAVAAGDEAAVEALARGGLAHAGSVQRHSARWARALGLSAAGRGVPKQAVEWLQRAVQSADADPSDSALLALALTAAGEDNAAVAVWERVSPQLWRQHAEWERGRLHARLRSGRVRAAHAEATAWLARHPADEATRQLLVNALERAGAYREALEIAGAAEEDLLWLRRRADLADRAQRTDLARVAHHALLARFDASRSDRLRAAEWFRDAGEPFVALQVAHDLKQTEGDPCASDVVTLVSSIAASDATALLAARLRALPSTCPGHQQWTRELVGRLMAAERFAEAAEFAEPLSVLSATSEDRDVAGRLRLWNGDAYAAAYLLLPLTHAHAASRAGVDAAIDALRLERRLSDAWALAAPLLADASLPAQRALGLAELAIDTGHGPEAQRVAERLRGEHSPVRVHALSVLGQALLISEEHAAALAALRTVGSALDARGADALARARHTLAWKALRDDTAATAVDLLTRDEEVPLSRDHRRTLAQAYVAAHRPADADREYRTLAADTDATAEEFLAWSRVHSDTAVRTEILREAHRRFPHSVDLTLARATAEWDAGDTTAAVTLARQVLAVDAHQVVAWRMLVDDLRTEGDPDLFTRLVAVPSLFATTPMTIVELADRLGAAGASAAASGTAVDWLLAIDTSARDVRSARDLAHARLLNSRGELGQALTIVSALVADDQSSAEVLRLHAQLLGWNGRHAESLSAYDRYLARYPDDSEARREQARVAGWGQRFERSRDLYAALRVSYPADAAARAEGDAKRFYYASRWQEADAAYLGWLSLEPGNEEALFERAETLVARGLVSDARAIYRQLAERPRPHEMAHLAERRLDERGDPIGGLHVASLSTNGYGGQRLLGSTEVGARLALRIGRDPRQHLEVTGNSLRFSDGRVQLPAYSVKTGVSFPGARSLLQGSVAAVRGTQGVGWWQGHAEAGVRLRPHVETRFALTRLPLLENLVTVRESLLVSGPALSLLLAHPDSELTVTARRGWLDDNRESVASLSLRQRVRRGRDEIRLVGGAMYQSWRQQDPRFFSPSGFVRADAGVEWTHWLRVPQFRLDRRSSLTARFLEGVDSRGDLYQQPHARLSLEHRRLGLDLESSWLRSPEYRSWSLQLGVRVGG